MSKTTIHKNVPLGFNTIKGQWKLLTICVDCGKNLSVLCFDEEGDYKDQIDEPLRCSKHWMSNAIKELRERTDDGWADDVREQVKWAVQEYYQKLNREGIDSDDKPYELAEEAMDRGFMEIPDSKLKELIQEETSNWDYDPADFPGQPCTT